MNCYEWNNLHQFAQTALNETIFYKLCNYSMVFNKIAMIAENI